MNAGRYAEAQVTARALLERHPNLGFAWKLYGVALLRQGKDAFIAFQKAVWHAPDDAEARFYAGYAFQDRGQMAEASASYHKALELRPDYAAALVGLADACRASGQLIAAVGNYRRALEFEPRWSEVHNNLGNMLLQLQEHEAAAASYRQALEIRPDLAEAHSNLGNALRSLGRLDEALTSYQRALALKPDFADALNNLGNTQLQLRQIEAAAHSYGRALRIQPGRADAHTNLGNALRDLGRLQEACVCYGQALEIKPDSAETHNNLGNVLLDLMQLDAAATCYQRALSLRPDYAHAHTGLSMVLRQQGRAAEAESHCRRALELQPESMEALTFLAEIHADQGQFAAAEALFRQALASDPDLPAAWAGIARYRRMDSSDGEWLQGARRALGKRLPLRHEINLRYAVGKYFDDTRDYAQAFESYRLANELTRRYGARYDRQELTRLFERTRCSFDARRLQHSRLATAGSERAVFIIGMPRSGTTLAEQILASHPAVFGAGELPFWNDAAAGYSGSEAERASAVPPLPTLAVDYLRRIVELSGDARRVVDKMPTNYLNVGLIHAALPDARFIHMRRNPADTCLSIFFQNFSISHAYANDLEDLAHHYSEYLRLMEHWHATLPPGVILDVSYEGLLDDQETWTRRMLEFIGLPWDSRCLDFHCTDRTVITPSKWQVRQKISKARAGRWRNYERYVGPLLRLLPPSAPAETQSVMPSHSTATIGSVRP